MLLLLPLPLNSIRRCLLVGVPAVVASVVMHHGM